MQAIQQENKHRVPLVLVNRRYGLSNSTRFQCSPLKVGFVELFDEL